MSDGDAGAPAGNADLGREVREIWDAKAAYWDERMGEGNLFHRVLIGPATERLLAVRTGETVLDIACGNGQVARRLAALGARLVACDISATFLDLARARTTEHADRIEYRWLDATDRDQLLALGPGRFDAAVCTMALMDMTEIDPLFDALPVLLKPGGRFVFSVPHPCFNTTGTVMVAEQADRGGELVTECGLKLTHYLDAPPQKGTGMPGEPLPHYYFDRPLHRLLGAGFRAGLVLDGLEERAFGPDETSPSPLNWINLKQFPPILAGRFRLPGAGDNARG